VHPDLLRALAQERQAELLRSHESRQSNGDLPLRPAYSPDTRVCRIRRVIGVALVGAGARLLGNTAASIEILDGRR
jgi:hypothetical protein